MSTQDWLWAVAAAALALALAAGGAEWARGRRRDLDTPGWVPWRGLQVVAFFAALGLAILAMKS
jgi:hypothetical protein